LPVAIFVLFFRKIEQVRPGCDFTFPISDRSGFEFAKIVFELAHQDPDAEIIHLAMAPEPTSPQSLTDLPGEDVGGEVWQGFNVHYTPTMAVGSIRHKSASYGGNAWVTEGSLISSPCAANPCLEPPNES
jgi:hypothetical protein